MKVKRTITIEIDIERLEEEFTLENVSKKKLKKEVNKFIDEVEKDPYEIMDVLGYFRYCKVVLMTSP